MSPDAISFPTTKSAKGFQYKLRHEDTQPHALTVRECGGVRFEDELALERVSIIQHANYPLAVAELDLNGFCYIEFIGFGGLVHWIALSNWGASRLAHSR